MILGASELAVLNNDPVENAKVLHSLANGVELMLDGDCWGKGNDTWDKEAVLLKNLGFEYTVHPPAWDCNIASGTYMLRRCAQELNIRALNVCSVLGAKQIVFHTGYCDSSSQFSRSIARNHSMAALEELISLAKPMGITVAVENVASPSVALYSQAEFAHILDGIDETAQYLIDLGHANMNGWNIPELINQIAPRLCGLHIHDNDGRSDQHLPIGHGTIPWKETFFEMAQLKNCCHFILEYAPGTNIQYLREDAMLLSERFS